LGLIGVLAWIIPLIGYPVTIIGFILGIVGYNKDKSGTAIAGIILSVLFFIATIISSILGVAIMKAKYGY
jgi:Na+/melibiose symporter-like transporter